jgi:hypothetical protein
VAHGAMRTLRAAWSRARRHDEGLEESPTIAVSRFKEEGRKSAIPLAQLPAWGAELAALRARGGRRATLADYWTLAFVAGMQGIDPATNT